MAYALKNIQLTTINVYDPDPAPPDPSVVRPTYTTRLLRTYLLRRFTTNAKVV